MSPRPRLCFMVTSPLTALTFLRGYLGFLREQGWEVILICAPGPGVVEMAQSEGVALRTISMRRDPAPIRDLVSLFRAVAILRRLRPDVLVYATPKASLIGALGGVIAGVQVRIYEQWGLRLETLSGYRRAIFTALERLTAKLSSTVIANSRSLASRLRELDLSSGREIVLLGEGSANGVDTDYFIARGHDRALDDDTKQFFAANKNALRVCFVGRLHPDKGIDTLLEGVSIASASGTALATVVVGPAEGADVDLPADVAVRLVGEVRDIRPYIEASDLLVLMSRREGFPTVVLEAASMGVPAIVSDGTGTIDSVLNRETGVVVPMGDAHTLASELSVIANNRALLRTYGGAARARVLNSFTQAHIWKLHSDHFRAGLEEMLQ